jgi:hypothetical protein
VGQGRRRGWRLASGLHFGYTIFMKTSIAVHQKKRGRGRPATGRDPAVTIRVPKEVLTAATKWGEEQGIASRSETLVNLIQRGLDAEAAAKPRRPETGRSKRKEVE